MRKIHAIDADNHNILFNRPGMISVIVGTDEDSQDAARAAGKAMYPFQGRPDFALIVVVDLRDSIANWVPSIVTARMRVSLDQEAVELKPCFLKNGNKSNPRSSTHVVPDFSGTVCPQLGWKDESEDLRVIIFGVDGREIERLDKVGIDDMSVLQEEVRKAIQKQIDLEQARLAEAAKTPAPNYSKPFTSIRRSFPTRLGRRRKTIETLFCFKRQFLPHSFGQKRFEQGLVGDIALVGQNFQFID